MSRIRWGSAAAIGLLLLLGLLLGFVRDFSGDFPAHLAEGVWMTTHHALLRSDVLSFSTLGTHRPTDSWLFDVVLALVYQAVGYPGCYLLRGIALAATLGILARQMVRQGLRPVTASILLAPIVAELAYRLFLRPDTFALPLLAATLGLLGAYERRARPVFLIAILPIVVVWANMDGTVLFGLFAIALFAVEQAARAATGGDPGRIHRLVAAGVGPLAVAASFLTPASPTERVAYLRGWLSDPAYHAGNDWYPLRFDMMSIGFVPMTAAIAMLALVPGRRASPWRLAVAAFAFATTMDHAVMVKAFFVSSAPLVATGLVTARTTFDGLGRGAAWGRVGKGLLGGVLTGTLALLFLEHRIQREVGLGLDPGFYPEAACRFARESPIRGRMGNSIDAGNFLLLCLPEHPVHVDSRSPLYSSRFLARYRGARTSSVTAKAYADAEDFSWTFLTFGDPLTKCLAADPDTWRLYYFDDQSALYLRRGRHENLALETDTFRYLDPAHIWLIPFLYGDALRDAQVELARQTRRCPTCATTHGMAAAVALAEHDEAGFTAAMTRVHPSMSAEWAILSAMRALSVHKPDRARGWFTFLGSFVPLPVAALTRAEGLAWAGDLDAADALVAETKTDATTTEALAYARSYIRHARARLSPARPDDTPSPR